MWDNQEYSLVIPGHITSLYSRLSHILPWFSFNTSREIQPEVAEVGPIPGLGAVPNYYVVVLLDLKQLG